MNKNLTLFLLSSILLISCSPDPTLLTVDKTDRVYSYAIGKGEEVFIGKHSYSNEIYVEKLGFKAVNQPHTIDSVILKNGKTLTDEMELDVKMDKYYFSLNVTCLAPFDDTIAIDYVKYYYEQDNTYLTIKYDATFTYNEKYLTEPSISNGSDSRIYDGKTCSFLLRNASFGTMGKGNPSIFLKSVYSSDDRLTLNNLKYAPFTPYERYPGGGVGYLSFHGIYSDLNYDFSLPVELKDYSDQYVYDGIVLRFDIVLDKDYDSFGTEIIFELVFNGTPYSISHNLSYDN